jgi:hypothetical protein
VDKQFLYKSKTYRWESLSRSLTARDYYLYKCTDLGEVEVDSFEQSGNKIKGEISLDTIQIDKIAGLSTFVAILKGK